MSENVGCLAWAVFMVATGLFAIAGSLSQIARAIQ
jgi:hypothetical protein